MRGTAGEGRTQKRRSLMDYDTRNASVLAGQQGLTYIC